MTALFVTVAVRPLVVTSPVRFGLVTVPAVKFAPVPLIFVPTKADGVPRFGVTKTGLSNDP